MRVESGNNNLSQLIAALEGGGIADQVAAIAAQQTEDGGTLRRAGQSQREVQEKHAEGARREIHDAIDKQMVASLVSAGASALSSLGSAFGASSAGGATCNVLGAGANATAAVFTREAGHQKLKGEAQLEHAQSRIAEGNESTRDGDAIERVATNSRDAMRQVVQAQHQAEMAALRA